MSEEIPEYKQFESKLVKEILPEITSLYSKGSKDPERFGLKIQSIVYEELADKWGEMPELLYKFLDIYKQKLADNKLPKDPEKISGIEMIAGLITSAIYDLKKDTEPMFKYKYGGLGVSISEELPSGLMISKKQLQFARIHGKTFANAVIGGQALWYSQVYGNACKGAVLTEKAFNHGIADENSFDCATLQSESGQVSHYKGESAKNAKFLDEAGKNSWVYGNSLEGCFYTKDALNNIIISGRTMKNAINLDAVELDAVIEQNEKLEKKSNQIELTDDDLDEMF